MDIRPILNCGLNLKQMVDLPTRNGKILDVLITNIPEFYNSPIIIPPVPCDNPASDHSVPVCYPHTDHTKPPLRRYRTVLSRPLPHSGVQQFGTWITKEPFSFSEDDISPDKQAQDMQELLMSKLDEFCPVKTVRLGPQDKPFINPELKALHRRRQREWLKNGNSDKYKKFFSEFEAKYCKAAKKYMRSKVDNLKESKPGQAYKILKDMGAQPGDCTDSHTFSLPSHQTENLSDLQSAERIAQHFAAIISEYKPLDISALPERVKVNLSTKTTPPIISEHECY